MPSEQVLLEIITQLQKTDDIDRLESQISILKQKFRELGTSYTGQPGFKQDADRLKDLLDQLNAIKGAAKRTADAEAQAAKDAADKIKEAARDARDAKIQAAKDAAAAAKQAARDEIQAARAAAREIIDAAHEEMEARQRAAHAGAGPVRLTGTERTAAKFQAGLAAANIAQDAIQGGPASTVNNFLGLAGNGKIRALAGEFLEAAGGVKTLAAGFGTVALAAGGAFLVIDGGLKSAKLGWGDLGDVIDEISGNAISGTFKNLGSAFGSVTDTAGGLIPRPARIAMRPR